MSKDHTPVLIAGAGPTGLVLALALARRGAPFRLVSQAAGPGEHSRAMGVHARTLEFYQQFGFADEVVAQGVPSGAMHLREKGRNGGSVEVSTFSFKDLGEGLSPYPFMLSYPQDLHERFLIEKLKAAGGAVEWNTTLTGFTQDAGGVRARLRHADAPEEEVAADWLAGCDGAHSQVRRTLGIGFPGGTYDQLFYVADVRIDRGFDPDIYANIGPETLCIMMPVRATGMQRLIGLMPTDLCNREHVSFEDLRPRLELLLDLKVTEVNWFSTYRVHHRVADRFHVGHAFLLGDAGHIHSPAGGQGMNTGIGDAVNLGWKLAEVVRGRAPASLLDTYEPERIAFARTLVATTDRAFTPMVEPGWKGELVRRIVAPIAATVMTRFAATRQKAFRTVSQVHIHYPNSPLSAGAAGYVAGGDRLPWTGFEGPDNFAPLASLDWQVHIYGDPEASVASVCTARGLPLHAIPWSKAAERASLKPEAVYLVRPDGYIAFAAAADQAAGKLEAYLDRVGLTLTEPPAGSERRTMK